MKTNVIKLVLFLGKNFVSKKIKVKWYLMMTRRKKKKKSLPFAKK
jgi:hypothetical protein